MSMPIDADHCHPPIEQQQAQYIVGYGSLMASSSKHSTIQSAGPSLPVHIQGFKRGWISPGNLPGFKITFLGVVRAPQDDFNAVIFKLPRQPEAIHAYDQRERSYCRHALQPEEIQSLTSQALPPGQWWIYLSKKKILQKPSQRYPIVQSYVDLFLKGCLEQAKRHHLKHFAQTCIQTTHYWSNHWVNDRIYPRRPFIHEPHAVTIDHLLKQFVPQPFKHIRIE
tara:strand:- start:175 stop:846 length:672 start_codon:yes stop_codon:yes gene_type:complete